MKCLLTHMFTCWRSGKGWLLTLGSCIALSALLSTASSAQTRLAWPDKRVDVASYQTVDECLAAVERVQDSASTPDQMIRALKAPEEATLSALYPVTVQVAERCSARWNASDVSLRDFNQMLKLFLQANRDEDASQLVLRRLNSGQGTADTGRFMVIDSIAEVYISAQPARFHEAESFVQQLEDLPKETGKGYTLIRHYSRISNAAALVNDDDLAIRSARKVVDIASGLTVEEKSTPIWMRIVRGLVYNAHSYLNWPVQLDSLKASTQSYADLAFDNWARTDAGNADRNEFPIGAEAKPLESEFWLTASDSIPQSAPDHPRPANGRISLIYFMNNSCPTINCWESYASLNRIYKAFPELEITIVTQTLGFFQNQVPPPPEVEARLYKQWLLDFHKLPAVLAVSETAFWRLHEPDRRRINEPTENRVNYTFGQWQPTGRVGYLIDDSGKVIYVAMVNQDSERKFKDLLRVLTSR